MSSEAHPPAPRAEQWLATVIAGLPLLYCLTDYSREPLFWHYSADLLGAIAVSGAFYAIVLLSYRWTLPRGLSQFRTRAIVTAFGLIAAFSCAEAIMALLDDRPGVVADRFRGYAPDPDTGYVYIPNYEQDITTVETTRHWRSNSIGLRADRDYGPKPPGVVRILALGDSFTVNTAVDASDTWPAVLERRLSETRGPSPRFEVVNAGHAAYGTMNIVNWYRKYGLSLKPDIVLIAMTPNDITDNRNELPGGFTAVDGYLVETGTTSTDVRRVFYRGRWFSLPGRLQRSRVWGLLRNASFGQREGSHLMACHEQLDEHEQELHQLTEKYTLEIRDLAASQGASFGLLLLTFEEQLGDMAPGYSGAMFGQRWTRFAVQHGIPVVDTYEETRRHEGPPLYWRWDYHYTAEGARLAGEAALGLMSQVLAAH